MNPSKDYADIARGIEGFLNLQPLLNSIQDILNDYFPAAYLIAFVLLVVGTMREFLFPETRRFMQNLLRAVLLVAAISFLPSFMNWCDQGNYEEKYPKLPTKLLILPPFSTDFHHCRWFPISKASDKMKEPGGSFRASEEGLIAAPQTPLG